MSETVAKIRALVSDGKVLVSAHGYEELAADVIYFSEIPDGLADTAVIEDYPAASKGSSVLVLQKDGDGRPVHVVWGIPGGKPKPAVTAYRPDPKKWTGDFMKRKQQ